MRLAGDSASATKALGYSVNGIRIAGRATQGVIGFNTADDEKVQRPLLEGVQGGLAAGVVIRRHAGMRSV